MIVVDDVVVVVVVVFSRTDSPRQGQSVIRSLRVFRVLRPFKGVHKIKKLQVC